MVVAQPPPAQSALARAEVDRLVESARAAALTARISGPAQTPFMLRHMAQASAGDTVRVNQALVLANARLAAELAVALARGAQDRAGQAVEGLDSAPRADARYRTKS